MEIRYDSFIAKGVLAFSAILSLAIGIVISWVIVWTMVTWAAMQSWHEKDAYIVSVELVSHHSDESTSYNVNALYAYQWKGLEYQGHRVSLHTGSDDIGSFYQRVAAELKAYHDHRKPFHCYVNPKNPTESVLYRNVRYEKTGPMMFLGLLFGFSGFMLIYSFFDITGNNRGRRALKKKYPDMPWYWRKEWKKGLISSHYKGKMVLFLLFTIFWNSMAFPVLLALPEEMRRGNTVVLVVVFFPLVGLGLIIAAIYQVLHWYRYGNTVFEMGAVPALIGGTLHGRILVSNGLSPTSELRAALNCVTRRTARQGETCGAKEEILWKTETIIPSKALAQDGRTTIIPIRFAIPENQLSTDESNPENERIWRLCVRTVSRGDDFAEDFEVPVFRIAESTPTEVDSAIIAIDEFGNPPPDNTP